jgi:hypothetical protein
MKGSPVRVRASASSACLKQRALSWVRANPAGTSRTHVRRGRRGPLADTYKRGHSASFARRESSPQPRTRGDSWREKPRQLTTARSPRRVTSLDVSLRAGCSFDSAPAAAALLDSHWNSGISATSLRSVERQRGTPHAVAAGNACGSLTARANPRSRRCTTLVMKGSAVRVRASAFTVAVEVRRAHVSSHAAPRSLG